MKGRTVSQLKKGETGTIKSFSDKVMSLKLLEMGCLPGCKVRLDAIAPLETPFALM